MNQFKGITTILPHTYQKKIDKQQQAWYNNPIKKGFRKMTFDVSNISSDPILSAILTQQISDLGNKIKKVWETNEFNLPLPVIAGGVLRDQIYGIFPHDFDIFVETKSIEDKRIVTGKLIC